MTEAELDAIKARCYAATPGPWTATLHPNGWHVEGAPVPDPAIPDRHKQVVHLGHEREADAEFIAHAREDIAALVLEVERLDRRPGPWCGPYILGRYSDNIVHADPCDCDLDEESAGDRCLDNSEWTYGVFSEGGAFAEPLVVRLPKRPPHQRDDDLDPLVAVAPERLTYTP